MEGDFEKRVMEFQRRCKRVYRELGVKTKKGRRRDVWKARRVRYKEGAGVR